MWERSAGELHSVLGFGGGSGAYIWGLLTSGSMCWLVRVEYQQTRTRKHA